MAYKPKPPPLIRRDHGVTWVDTAMLALFALDQPVPSASATKFIAKWRGMANEQKRSEALRLLTPHFVAEDLVTHTRVVTLKRAGELLSEHVAALKGNVAPLNVGTEERPRNIAVAVGSTGALAFLLLLNQHRGAKKKNREADCRALTATLVPLCEQRTTDAKARRLVDYVNFLTELHELTAHLASASLRTLAVQQPSNTNT
jgi:hypothetical protein